MGKTANYNFPTLSDSEINTKSGREWVLDVNGDDAASGFSQIDAAIKGVEGKADEAKSIAQGRSRGVSYGSYATMVAALNAADKDEFQLGDNILIQATGVPDFWVSGVASNAVSYTYASDQAMIDAITLAGNLQIGFFKISFLETQKVDLTDYAKVAQLEVHAGDQIKHLTAAERTSWNAKETPTGAQNKANAAKAAAIAAAASDATERANTAKNEAIAAAAVDATAKANQAEANAKAASRPVSWMPTAGDVGAASGSRFTATLTVEGWDSTYRYQSINNDLITDASTIFVAPTAYVSDSGISKENYDEYVLKAVRAMGQSAGKITFTCASLPIMDLSVDIIVMEGIK